MIGALPTSLEVGGREWAIRSDYRNILCIFEAMDDDSLSDQDRLYIMLKRIYVDFDIMTKDMYQEAYEKATRFMECHDRTEDKKNPKLINWQI